MVSSKPLYLFSCAVMLFTKAFVIAYMVSAGDYDLLSLKNSQKHIQAHRNRVFKQLTLAIITFRVSRHMLKRSVLSFILFSIIVIKFLTVQVKLVKLARSLRPFHGPLHLTACILMSGAFFYLKLVVEVSWAVYYLVMLCRNPSIRDTCVLLLGLLRLLDWK